MRLSFIIIPILFIGCSTAEKTTVKTQPAEEFNIGWLNIARLDSDMAIEIRRMDSIFGPVDSTYISQHPIELDSLGRPIFRYYDPTMCDCEAVREEIMQRQNDSIMVGNHWQKVSEWGYKFRKDDTLVLDDTTGLGLLPNFRSGFPIISNRISP
jgi:hypothetical protein